MSVVHHFSPLLFVITIIATLSVLFGAAWLIMPVHIWHVQFHSSIAYFAAVFITMHFVNAGIEYFFHRYVLHAPLLTFLVYFWKRHEHHHGLTRVSLGKTSGMVENRYPILEETQHEASFFPWYSLIVFSLIATPPLVFIQWLLPNAPIFSAGYLAIAWSLFLYETLHAIEHWPLTKWQPLLEHLRYGNFWKAVYAFHLRHHADTKSNESISGFFGLPIFDLIFRTWVNPLTLYKHGKSNTIEEFVSPIPRAPIRWLDKVVILQAKRRRLKAAT